MSNQNGQSHPVLDSHAPAPVNAWDERVERLRSGNSDAVRSLIRIGGTFAFLVAVIALLALLA